MPKSSPARWLALPLVGALALTGCGRDYAADETQTADAPVVVSETAAGPYHGVELQQPLTKPDVDLTDTEGQVINLARDTDGQVVLVYAGYTNCPDVCPTTVADLAAALRGLPAQQRDQVTVVMMSTDPLRDTQERMRAFLDQFDASFVGVTGEAEVIIPAINTMGIDVQEPTTAPDGAVLVEHGAQVIAFAPPENTAGLLWTSGTSITEYRDDIQTLLASLP